MTTTAATDRTGDHLGCTQLVDLTHTEVRHAVNTQIERLDPRVVRVLGLCDEVRT
jgi:hypothetical protein